jgi:uncharacterized membrane protein YqhA
LRAVQRRFNGSIGATRTKSFYAFIVSLVYAFVLFLLATYAEVIMLSEQRLTAVSGGRNIKA